MQKVGLKNSFACGFERVADGLSGFLRFELHNLLTELVTIVRFLAEEDFHVVDVSIICDFQFNPAHSFFRRAKSLDQLNAFEFTTYMSHRQHCFSELPSGTSISSCFDVPFPNIFNIGTHFTSLGANIKLSE
jgi:hypothetical protein